MKSKVFRTPFYVLCISRVGSGYSDILRRIWPFRGISHHARSTHLELLVTNLGHSEETLTMAEEIKAPKREFRMPSLGLME